MGRIGWVYLSISVKTEQQENIEKIILLIRLHFRLWKVLKIEDKRYIYENIGDCNLFTAICWLCEYKGAKLYKLFESVQK